MNGEIWGCLNEKVRRKCCSVYGRSSAKIAICDDVKMIRVYLGPVVHLTENIMRFIE